MPSIEEIETQVANLDGASKLLEDDAIAGCPVMLQRLVTGRDVRVTVVGHELFATHIDIEDRGADEADWRVVPEERLSYSQIEISGRLAECIERPPQIQTGPVIARPRKPTSPGRLMAATWNIANLGVHERRNKDYRLIAEMFLGSTWSHPRGQRQPHWRVHMTLLMG